MKNKDRQKQKQDLKLQQQQKQTKQNQNKENLNSTVHHVQALVTWVHCLLNFEHLAVFGLICVRLFTIDYTVYNLWNKIIQR